MRKIISFMHISLDGFVAGPNGELDWVPQETNRQQPGTILNIQNGIAKFTKLSYQKR